MSNSPAIQLGARIKQARIGAGLSLRKLADKTDNYVSAQVIHKYELGKTVPGSDVLIRLGRALGVKTEFFFRSQRTFVELSLPVYRKRSSVGEKELKALQARTKEQVEKYLEVEQLFPEGRWTSANIRPENKRLVPSYDEVEKAAEQLRDEWRLGRDPIEHLTEVLEDHGIKVVMLEAAHRFDGLSCFANDGIPVLVVRKGGPVDRLRFSLAHELGHLHLRHSGVVTAEKAADRFAGAFLVPAEACRRELGNDRRSLTFAELDLLKLKYGMSIQAWLYRARDLGIITESYHLGIIRRLKAAGEYSNELGTVLLPDLEQSKRLELLVTQAVGQGLISVARGAELLDVPLESYRLRFKKEGVFEGVGV